MKKIVISFTTVVAATAVLFSAPIRSNLGGDGIERGETVSYTAADYIQDGLVNLWDAVENVDWGVHTDHATSWTDLVGGFVLQTGGGAVGDFTGGYAHYKTAFYNGAGDPATLQSIRYYDKAELQRRVINSGRWTIEVVHRPKGGYNLFLFGLRSSHTALRLEPSKLTFRSGILASGTGLSYTPMETNQRESRSIVCYVDEWSIYTCYNGVADAMANLNSSTAWPSSWYNGPLIHYNTCIGFTAYNNPSNWNANQEGGSDIYCFRIYNRPLTEEEIAYNYSIDKARFGL